MRVESGERWWLWSVVYDIAVEVLLRREPLGSVVDKFKVKLRIFFDDGQAVDSV